MTNSVPTDTTYRAVLFDFDGTLVDTMPLHYEAYRQTFAEINLELLRLDFDRHIGGAGRETIPKFLDGRHSPWSIEQIHRRKKELLLSLLVNMPIARLPTSYLLPLLKDRVPMAVATSGSRVGIDAMLAQLGWSTYFGAVVTADEVERGKPAPDLFLKAASLLRVPASECLVFEDTDDGVTAGKAAKARVIDIRKMAIPAECGSQ